MRAEDARAGGRIRAAFAGSRPDSRRRPVPVWLRHGVFFGPGFLVSTTMIRSLCHKLMGKIYFGLMQHVTHCLALNWRL